MYPSAEVTRFVTEHFVPVRVRVKEQPDTWHRFAIRWTPTVMTLVPGGREARRLEGFLPTEDFLAELQLQLAFAHVEEKEWKEAEEWFEKVLRDRPDAETAPEALYWAGVCRYSASRDPAELAKLALQFGERYTNTSWAKRSMVWRK